MKLSVENALLKNRAKTMMEGKYYAAVMALIFFNMVTMLLNNFSVSLSLQISSSLQKMLGLSQAGTALVILSYLIVFLFTALCGVFRIGICLFFLNIACGQYFGTYDLFYGFLQHFRKSYGLSLVITLLTTLCLAPLDILLYLLKNTDRIRMDVLALLLCTQLILLMIYLPLSLSLSQSYYIMLDYPDLGLAAILRQSIRLMKGRKLRLFYLQLSFLPLMLLVIPTFGLGALWLTPYKNMTYALFYLENMKREA